MQSGLKRIDVLYGHSKGTVKFQSRALTSIRLKALNQSWDSSTLSASKSALKRLTTEKSSLSYSSPIKLSNSDTIHLRASTPNARRDPLLQYPCDENLSRDTAIADAEELSKRESVAAVLTAHADGTDPTLTSSAAILTTIAHRRTEEHRRYLRSLERLLILDDAGGDLRLAAAIDSAVASELRACFQANSRPSRYCVF